MYYFYINNVKEGPYTLEELPIKDITPDVLVWREGFADWKPAKDVPELSAILSKIPPEPNKTKKYGPMPKTWFVESLLVTLFCCLPFGLVGIIESNKVEPMYNSGQYEQALYHSKQAKKWVLWGFFVMLACGLLYLLGIIILLLFTATTLSGSTLC